VVTIVAVMVGAEDPMADADADVPDEVADDTDVVRQPAMPTATATPARRSVRMVITVNETPSGRHALTAFS
jgi:hypothetical protein